MLIPVTNPLVHSEAKPDDLLIVWCERVLTPGLDVGFVLSELWWTGGRGFGLRFVLSGGGGGGGGGR